MSSLVAMVIVTKCTSAGVPTNAPITPAVIPSPAFIANPGGFPSGLLSKHQLLGVMNKEELGILPAHCIKKPSVDS